MLRVILFLFLAMSTLSVSAQTQRIDPEVSSIRRIVEIRYHNANHQIVGIQTIVCNGQVFGDEPATYDHKHFVNTDYCGGVFSPIDDDIQQFCEDNFNTLEDQLACININSDDSSSDSTSSSKNLLRHIIEQ